MEANGEGLGLLVRHEIGLGLLDRAQQTSRIVMAHYRSHERSGQTAKICSTRCFPAMGSKLNP
jgi:hypothetical protein